MSDSRPMTTAGLQAKVELRRAWFEANPNQPIPEARAQVDRLIAAIEREVLRTPYGMVPANCRLILASDNLLDNWGTRTERGERITVEWGEPSPEGWYEPQFTVHADDVLEPPA